MAVDEKLEDEILDWNVDTEVQLFHAMRGHKPVGVNRFFQMACIHEKFSNSLNREINSQNIWDRLETMYDMAALHESEILPFPNDELDFALPHFDFGKLLTDRNGGESIPLPTSVKVKVEPKKSEPQEGRSKSGKEVYSGGKTKHDNYSSSNSSTSSSSNISSKPVKIEAPVPTKNIKVEEKSKESLPETPKSKSDPKKDVSSTLTLKTYRQEPSNPTVKSESSKSAKVESKSGKETTSKNVKPEEKVSKLRTDNVSTPKTSRSDSTSSSSSKTSKAEASVNSGNSSTSKISKSESSQKKKDDPKSTKESKSSKTDPDDIPLSKISTPKSKRHESKEGSIPKRKRPARQSESSSSSSRGNTPTAKRRRI